MRCVSLPAVCRFAVIVCACMSCLFVFVCAYVADLLLFCFVLWLLSSLCLHCVRFADVLLVLLFGLMMFAVVFLVHCCYVCFFCLCIVRVCSFACLVCLLLCLSFVL